MDRYYEEGFCKTAEAYGVDPAELYKQALVPPNLRNFGSIFKRVAGARHHPVYYNKLHQSLLGSGKLNADQIAKIQDQRKFWLLSSIDKQRLELNNIVKQLEATHGKVPSNMQMEIDKLRGHLDRRYSRVHDIHYPASDISYAPSAWARSLDLNTHDNATRLILSRPI